MKIKFISIDEDEFWLAHVVYFGYGKRHYINNRWLLYVVPNGYTYAKLDIQQPMYYRTVEVLLLSEVLTYFKSH